MAAWAGGPHWADRAGADDRGGRLRRPTRGVQSGAVLDLQPSRPSPRPRIAVGGSEWLAAGRGCWSGGCRRAVCCWWLRSRWPWSPLTAGSALSSRRAGERNSVRFTDIRTTSGGGGVKKRASLSSCHCQNHQVCLFSGCFTAYSQAGENRNQLNNNLKITKLEDFASDYSSLI